jgi:hypothetical protein
MPGEAQMAAQMIGGEIVLSYDARQFDELTAADVVDRPNWQTKVSTFMAKTFLRRAYDELVGMSGIVMTSGIEWTIVRFIAPKDGPHADTSGRGSTATTSPIQGHPGRHCRLHRRAGRR